MNEVNFFLLTDKPNIIHLILICLANKLHLFTLKLKHVQKIENAFMVSQEFCFMNCLYRSEFKIQLADSEQFTTLQI